MQQMTSFLAHIRRKTNSSDRHSPRTDHHRIPELSRQRESNSRSKRKHLENILQCHFSRREASTSMFLDILHNAIRLVHTTHNPIGECPRSHLPPEQGTEQTNQIPKAQPDSKQRPQSAYPPRTGSSSPNQQKPQQHQPRRRIAS